MKLKETIPALKYKRPDPKSGINWDIPPHPKYTLYPELQDAIWKRLGQLTPDHKRDLLAKYGVMNSLQLHVLPIDKMFELEAELSELIP